MQKFVFSLIILATPATAFSHQFLVPSTQDCEQVLSATPEGARQEFAGFIKVSSGSEVFTRIERPKWRRAKGWFFLVHGLMDTHRAYDRIATQLLSEGYGVVRIDLPGFGFTLEHAIQLAHDNGRPYVPPVYSNYRDDLTVLKDVLVHLRDDFKISQPQMVGHSMGGGLVLALMAEPSARELVAPEATVIAPYVYRLEYYLAEKIAFFGFTTQGQLPTLDDWMPSMLRLAPEYLMDLMVTNHQLRIAFGEFFDRLIQSRQITLSPSRLAALRKQTVENGLAVMKGLRELNSLNIARALPEGTKVNLIYGDHDEVVEKGLARKLGYSLSLRGGRIFEVNAGHMILEDQPELVTRLIVGMKPH